MQQFSSFPSFQPYYQDVDMIEEELVMDQMPVPQPVTAPLILISGQIPVITTKQLADISGISPIETGALSLTDALQSTMGANTPGRTLVIPGSRKRKQAKQRRDEIVSTLHMSTRMRHGIIIAAILSIVVFALLSLSPLATGQIRLPVFSTIGNWVHEQQLSWQVQAHQTTVSQPVLNNPVLPPMNLPKSQYVAIAQQDAIAVGISPDYFVRQINMESGFNPNSASPMGAVGIAQFMPGTAAGLGINPWDPIQALRGAALLMAKYAQNYGGDYAKALAAYNGGSGTLQYAVTNCGADWLNCLPGETRHYIYVIMGI